MTFVFVYLQIEVIATAGEGIGFANPLSAVGGNATATSKKQEQWKQAQERFRKLPDVVHSSDDGSDWNFSILLAPNK